MSHRLRATEFRSASQPGRPLPSYHFIFYFQLFTLSNFSQSLAALEYGKELEALSSKPNTTQAILSTNPEWNDIIFCETLEEKVQDDCKLLHN
jgi:hypothetical protein